MVTRPLISVMIAAYNAERYVEEAIESVLTQNYRPLELIVVDDGSTDHTAERVRHHSDVRYLHQANAGNGSARNLAVGAATGDYFAFLDADDRFTPGRLARQLNALSSDSEIDVVYGHVQEFVSPELDEPTRRTIRAPIAEPSPYMSPSVMLIGREAFMRVGEFSTTLRVGVTVDWIARAKDAGLRHLILEDVVLERRLHTDNNGLRNRDARSDYLQVVRAAMARRAAANEASVSDPQTREHRSE
jgi:glycosyltransferase involved in cell wall biosynthesis